MYPQVNKEQIPSAPPPYSESANAPKYTENPQYPSYPPPMGSSHQPTQVIVVQAPALPPLGPKAVELTCPTCKTCIRTTVEEESSNTAYLCCMLLFVVGCFICSCIPFCMDNFKNYKHTCPRCNAFIGLYQP